MSTINWVNSSGGDWSSASNWSSDTVPDGDDNVQITGTYVVTITTNIAFASITASGAVLSIEGGYLNGGTLIADYGGVFETASGQTSTLDSVTIGSGTTYTGENDSTTYLSGTIANDGTLALTTTGAETYYLASGTTAIDGVGTLQLNGTSDLVGENIGSTLTIGSGQTVEGTGVLSFYPGYMRNQGLIDANQQASLTVTGVTNDATVEATDGGTLIVSGVETNNGLIEADDGAVDVNGLITQDGDGVTEVVAGSTVELQNDGEIDGGTLTAESGGILETAADQNALLDGVTIASGATYTGEDGSSTSLYDTIINDGTLALASTGDATSFVGFGATISGTGTILLSANANNSILDHDVTFTIGSGQTVEGSGQIYGYGAAEDNSPAIVNDGLFLANQSTPLTVGSYVENLATFKAAAGGTLDIGGSTVPYAGVVNDDVIEADGGAVDVIGVVAQGADGVVEAVNGGTVALGAPGDRGWISGGTLTAESGGILETAADQNALLDGVTIASGATYTGEDGSSTSLYDTIINDGTLALASTGDATGFSAGNNVVLGGAGNVMLGDNANNYIYAGGGLSTLTIGAGQVVDGAGDIFGGSAGAITNDGLILANQQVALMAGAGVTNAGTLEAAAGSTLNLGDIQNDGVVEADSGTLVLLGDYHIGGLFTFLGSNNTLQIDGVDALSAAPTADGSNTDLTVELSDGSSLVYTLAGDYVGKTFAPTQVSGNSVIAIPVQSGSLSISAPAMSTIGSGQPDPISEISIAESPTTDSEIFTVVLSDSNGDLAAIGTGVTGSGTPVLTVSGSYAQVNSVLSTLTDTDASPGSDTITIAASDSDGGVATPSTIAIGVNGAPILTAPAEATIGVGQTSAVDGVSLAESGNTSAETFAVTVSDTNGELSAGGSGVSGSGTTSLTINGSLAQVNAALAKLTDADSVAGSDVITINASDSLGNNAGQSEIAVDVNGPPVLTVPATAIVNQDSAIPILIVGLSETGNVSNETFTVTLSDNSGLLSATGLGVSGSGTTDLTITGSFSQVRRDLATLTDTDPASTPDSITVRATDSLGNEAAQQSIAVDVQPITLGALQAIAGGVAITIDWSSLENSLRPVYIDSTDWGLIWDRFVGQVGTTTQTLLAAITPIAAEAGLTSAATTDVATLLNDELAQASAALPNITLAATTDLALAGSGLDLSLTRTYSASLLNRNKAGAFGDGWTFNYGVQAMTDASGDVYITSPTGTEVFTLNPDGTYSAEAGDSGTLKELNGAYVLTEPSGAVEKFLADGDLASIADSNGDVVTVSYGADGFISGVTSSNGQSIAFNTNAAGRITSATDSHGETITYTYDASDDQLLSVTGPDGATTYSYSSSSNEYVTNALTGITNPAGVQQTFTYDDVGDLASQTGAGGVVSYSYPSAGILVETDAADDKTTLSYDESGNLIGAIDAEGNGTTLTNDSRGDLTSVVTPLGETYTYAYDGLGNLTTYTDPTGGGVTATYAPGTNLLTSLTDQNGNTTDYTYNSAGDLTGITYDNGSTQTYTYSSWGAVTSSTDQMMRTTTYAYNSQGLLTNEAFSDGTSQSYNYNALGELTMATATNGAVTSYTYNVGGELTSFTNAAGQVECYTWNALGQEASRTEPDGSVTNYTYNADGQLAKLTDGSGNLITQYTYNSLGQLAGSIDGNGQTTSYNYDADGDVTQILVKDASGNVTSNLTYTYDPDGRPITATSLDGTWTYSYNSDSELVHAVFDSTDDSIANQNLTYVYDAAGNRTKTIFNGAVDDYTTNGLNQYTSVNGTSYDYDADGNLVSMTQDGQTTSYAYNEQNELVEVNGPSATTTYTYDALGNVVTATDNGITTNYVIDPLAASTLATGPLSAIAQAYGSAGQLEATYDYGNGLVALANNGETYYYNLDSIGSVTSLSGPNSALEDTYAYDPFGNLLGYSVGAISNSFEYGGGFGLVTDSDDLTIMGLRDYDLISGRFISEDPTNISGGLNLYDYVDSGPTFAIDPSGTSEQPSGGFIREWLEESAEPWLENTAEYFADKLEATVGVGATLVGGIATTTEAVPVLQQVYANRDVVNSVGVGADATDQLLNALDRQKSLSASPTARLNPDPHLITFDGLHYDFQTVGEFLLVKDTNGGTFQVQARLSAPESVSNYSVITEIGIQVGQDVVTIDSTRSDSVWIDGQALTYTGNAIALADGLITQTSTGYVVTLNTGESVTATLNGNSFGTQNGPSTSSLFGMSVSVSLAPNAAHGSVEGLMGNYNGNPDDDLTLADGTVEPTDMSTSTLYGAYADSWRVTQSTSLLNYGPGQTTATFTDTSYPGTPISVSSFPTQAVAAATQLVEQAGITDPGLQQEAIYDYLVTGDPSVISVEANLQQQGVTTTTQAEFVAPPPPTEVGIMALEPSDVEAASGPTTANFEIYATGNSNQAVTVDYTVVAPDDAFLGLGDFGGALPSGSLTLAAGQASADLSIMLPDGIGAAESKTLEVQISAVAPVSVIGPSAQETILNDAPVAGPAPVFGVQLVNLPNLLPTQNGTNWTFNLGALKQGEVFNPGDLTLAVLNMADDDGDSLDGTIAASGDGGLPSAVSPSFTGLGPDGILDIADLAVETTILGTHTETFTFTPYDTNATGYTAIMPTETFTLTDMVYPLAQAELSTKDIGFGVVRAGSSQQQTIGITNDGPTGAESLDASIGALTGAGAGVGSISLLAVGQTSSAITVGLNTSEAGSVSGSVAVDLSSDGANVDGLGSTPLLSQDVAVTGTVFREAVGQVTPAQAIVHVGDPGTANLVVSNTDPADGYSEGLLATLVSFSGAISASGVPTALIAAGASDSTSLSASFSTATAGTVSGNVDVDFQTDGEGTSGLGTLDLGTSDIPIFITVDNYAQAAWEEISGGGTFQQNGQNYTLNLGSVDEGSSPVTVDLGVLNAASGPADLLSGEFRTSQSSAFTLSGFDGFSSLAAGQSDAAPTVTLDTISVGTFTETITLDPTGSNASGYSGALPQTTLTITGTVVTPIPDLTVAQYLAEPSAADQAPDGFDITDSAAEVSTIFNILSADPHLDAINLTDAGTPTLTLTIDEALEDQSTLAKITTPYNTMLADTPADIEAVSASQAAALKAAGYVSVAARGPVTLTLAEATLLGGDGIVVKGGPTTVAGTVAAILALTAAQTSTYTAAGYMLAVQDTAAHIEALTTTQIASLSKLGVSQVSATDATLAMTVAQAEAFESAHIALSAPAGDAVEVSDTAAHLQALTAAQIAALPGVGVSELVSNNGVVKLTVAQVAALESAPVKVAAPGASATLSDTAANLETLTAAEIAGLAATGISAVASSNASLTLSLVQALAFAAARLKPSVPSGGKVTISETAADVEALSAARIAELAGVGVTAITATGGGVTLSAALALALETAGIGLTAPSGDSDALTDTAAHVEALTTTEIAGLTALHVTAIATTDVGARLSVAQAAALETAKIGLAAPSGATAAIADTAADIEALTTTQIASLFKLGVSQVSATDATLAMTVAQAEAFESAHIALSAPAGDAVEVSDTAAHLQALTAAQIAALPGVGVSELVSNNGVVKLTVAQVAALESAPVKVAAPGASATLSDTAANLETLTAAEIAGLAATGISAVASSNASLTLSLVQALAFAAAGLKPSVPSGGKVTISDTAADVEVLSAARIAELAGVGVTAIAATGGGVTLSAAQALALETAGIGLTPPSGDSDALADTAAHVDALTTTEIAGLTALHVTAMATTDVGAQLSVAQAAALETAKIGLAAPSGATAAIADTAAHVETLTTTQIASLSKLGVSQVSATDATLSVTVAQAEAFESAHIALLAPAGDAVEVSDTAAHLQALTAAQTAALSGVGVSELVSNNGAIKFTVAQVAALESAPVKVVASGASATLSDTAANLETLTAAEIAGLAATGISAVASSNASLTLSLVQALAFAAAGLKPSVPSGGKVTISDTAADVEVLSAARIAELAGVGVTAIAATGGGVTLSAAQALALETAGIGLTPPSGDSDTLADTAAYVDALTTTEIAGLTALHVTAIATTDIGAQLSVAQAAALEAAKIGLAAPSGATAAIADTAAHIETLTTTQIASLSRLGVSQVSATDATLAVTAAQAEAFETAYIALSAPSVDVVEVSDTAAHLQALTAAQIAALPGVGISELYADNANVIYTAAQTSAILAAGLSIVATGADTVTENFANGGYDVYSGGALVSQKSANADGSYDITNYAVTGQAYTSDEYVYRGSGAEAAFAANDSIGAGTLTILGAGEFISVGPGVLSVEVGADLFALPPHGGEIITATSATSAAFDFAPTVPTAAAWTDQISGFVATGSSHETLQFAAAAFGSGLTSADQTADWQALVGHMTQNSAGQAIIADIDGDTLTLAGVTKATLSVTANATDFKFV